MILHCNNERRVLLTKIIRFNKLNILSRPRRSQRAFFSSLHLARSLGPLPTRATLAYFFFEQSSHAPGLSFRSFFAQALYATNPPAYMEIDESMTLVKIRAFASTRYIHTFFSSHFSFDALVSATRVNIRAGRIFRAQALFIVRARAHTHNLHCHAEQ